MSESSDKHSDLVWDLKVLEEDIEAVGSAKRRITLHPRTAVLQYPQIAHRAVNFAMEHRSIGCGVVFPESVLHLFGVKISLAAGYEPQEC